MYRAEQKQISAEGDSVTVWGISDENGFILDFTTDYEKAEKLAAILNENLVERQHAAEIAEDLFYSG